MKLEKQKNETHEQADLISSGTYKTNILSVKNQTLVDWLRTG